MWVFHRVRRHFYNKWDWDNDEKIIPNFKNWLSFYLFRKKTKILTINETINYILTTGCSVARYGDGEFKCMMGVGNDFQHEDVLLSEKLKEILSDNVAQNCLICIPNVDELYKEFGGSRWFWKKFIRQNGKKLLQFICRKRVFGAAHFTRFYLGRNNRNDAAKNIEGIKRIWDNKDLLIVEGSLSKLGVCNDLFSNANSVKRIIAPSENAFSKYDDILQTVISHYNREIILIALGQTATVLAYELSKKGMQAIDVGHIDIEYMWFLMGVKERTIIKGKHTAELADDMSELDADEEEKYRSQIIAKIDFN